MTPTFEENLLQELRAIVAEQRLPAAAPAIRRRDPRPRLLGAGAATLAAAAGATLILAIGGGDPVEPAFAVERNSDDTVSVTVNSLQDADGLERALKAEGISAVVDYVPAGKTCKEPRGKPPAARDGGGKTTIAGRQSADGSSTLTLSRNIVGAGNTLVLMSSAEKGQVRLGTAIVSGPVAPCELIDAPEPSSVPATPHGSDSGPTTSRGVSGEKSLHTGP